MRQRDSSGAAQRKPLTCKRLCMQILVLRHPAFCHLPALKFPLLQRRHRHDAHGELVHEAFLRNRLHILRQDPPFPPPVFPLFQRFPAPRRLEIPGGGQVHFRCMQIPSFTKILEVAPSAISLWYSGKSAPGFPLHEPPFLQNTVPWFRDFR